MLKKIFTFILLISLPIIVFAQSAILPDEKISSDQTTIQIPITVNNLTDLEGLEITINYDDTKLDVNETTLSGGILESDYDLMENKSTGELRLVIYATGDLFSGLGEVAYVTFNILSSFNSGPTPLNITKFHVNETNKIENTTDGTITKNTVPNADDDTGETDEDVPVDIDVLDNDSDPDGDDLTITSISVPTHGSVADNGDGTVTYTPNTGYSGGDFFTYTISDGNAGSDDATVNITVNAPNNQSPTANAGDDQTVTDTDNSGSESVTLDGSGSNDPDGSIASYSWTEGTTEIATGEGPAIDLSLGSHTIALTVTDDDGATSSDEVIITVNAPDNQSPTANAGSDQTVTDTDNSGSESVTLDGSGSSDLNGTISSYSWTEGTTEIATGEGPAIDLSLGSHTITLTVTDDDGATSSDVVEITVNSGHNNAPPVISNFNFQASGFYKPLLIDVDITDDVSVETATLFYLVGMGNQQNTPVWGSIQMVKNTGDNYQAIIPGASITENGLSIKIVATDNERETETFETYIEGNSLPVTLTSFIARSENGKVYVEWKTESEVNNLGFNIYKSLEENGHFSIINPIIIRGAGNSSSSHEYVYVDDQVISGMTYYYKMEDIGTNGKTKMHNTVSVIVESSKMSLFADEFNLFNAYPNPFNPNTTISYSIPQESNVLLAIYNTQGEMVETLVNSRQSSGYYSINWNAINMPSGIYFYKITAGDYNNIMKCILMK